MTSDDVLNINGVPKGENGQNISARGNSGQFVALGQSSNTNASTVESLDHQVQNIKDTYAKTGDMGNMLKHIENLEKKVRAREMELADAQRKA